MMRGETDRGRHVDGDGDGGGHGNLIQLAKCPEVLAMKEGMSTLSTRQPAHHFSPSQTHTNENTTTILSDTVSSIASSLLKLQSTSPSLASGTSQFSKQPALRHSFPVPRKPLQLLHQNASIMFRAAQTSATTSTSNPIKPKLRNDATKSPAMPLDRPKNPRALTSNSSATPPLKPKLPVTPRVAASNSTITPTTRRSNRDAAHDVTTPVATLLANNVTPRSGNRRSRFDSPADTPTTTPTPTLLSHKANLQVDYVEPSRPVSPARSAVGHHGQSVDTDKDSKFFFASDAKSMVQSSQPTNRPALTSKNSSSSFLYANGSTLQSSNPPTSSTARGSMLSSATIPDKSQPKFFRANASPDVRPLPHSHPTASVTASSTSRLVQTPAHSLPSPRSVSPTKNISPAPGPPKNTPLTPTLSKAPHAPTIHQKHLRKTSIDVSPRVIGHVSNASIGSESGGKALSSKRSSVGSDIGITPHLAKRFSNGSIPAPNHPPSPIYSIPSPGQPSAGAPPLGSFFPGIVSPGLSSMGSYLDDVAESSTEDIKADNSSAPSTLSTHSEEPEAAEGVNSLAKMNELAAQARKERKVLDLEIRNTSLESINKTLERQMRKQTAELRRYRRLSRSGRLSNLSTSSRRSTIDRLSRIGEDGEYSGEDDTFGFTDDDLDFAGVNDDDSDGSEDFDEVNLSPEAIAANDAKHRERDEKRLQLDLTKHQQLLIDSQKMNQSLKKCLSWTEELIADGKKALAYNVKVSEVQLGGRVLSPDIDEEEEGGLGGDSFEPIIHEGDSMHERMSEISSIAWHTSNDAKFDRDSGIDILHPCLEV